MYRDIRIITEITGFVLVIRKISETILTRAGKSSKKLFIIRSKKVGYIRIKNVPSAK
jgi:hypothetical protein